MFIEYIYFADLPFILSDKYLAISDPQSKFFDDGNKTGQRYNLKDIVPDAFIAPFDDIRSFFKCSDNTCCNGTIFRFPLRQNPSELSNTLYDSEKVKALFDSFTYDAHLILLFLKNITSIGLYIKPKEQHNIVPIFTVKISKDSLNDGCRTRLSFVKKIKAGCIAEEALSCTYKLSVETTSYHDGKIDKTENYQFLISEYFAGGDVSLQLRELTREQSFGYPLVGVAKELDVNKNSSFGQVFCFLPLPVEEKSVTDLPVHVNGCFAVSQNRRHLKWPTGGQEIKAERSDNSLIWNKCLLEELLPKAYFNLIRDAIVMNQMNDLHQDHIINSLPNRSVVNEKWCGIIEPLFKALFDIPMFYTKSCNGKWLKGEECWFDCYLHKTEYDSIITSFLNDANKPIVSCPTYLMTTLTDFCVEQPITISPHLVRTSILEDISLIERFDFEEKNILLKYCITELGESDLQGIPLLPLANGDCIQFNSSHEYIYITSEQFPVTLLQCLERIILATELEQVVETTLKCFAEKGIILIY